LKIKDTNQIKTRITPGQRSNESTGPSRQKIWQMFDRIARRYDLLNRLLSFRQDVRWRQKLGQYLPEGQNQIVLDIATGTADVLLSLIQKNQQIERGIGLDMAREMLRTGRIKILDRSVQNRLQLLPGDSHNLPFSSDSFHIVTIAFGIRNLIDIQQGLLEMYRVLKPGGRLLILEFSLPDNLIFRKIYLFYFRKILPILGGLVSGDSYAYRYLNQTVETFPYGAEFKSIMEETGFTNVADISLSFGIASIYYGDKIC
jgi:demethylmenaquinone methyltransferase/2-methoxy-6-polyprenyl-1,4-benzoquinol methylase